MSDLRKIKRALISVSDKRGISDFARRLTEFGVEIISTGGTARALRDAEIPVRDVSDETGFPEMLDGRVKTLHPKIHGALLALRDNKSHQSSLAEHKIAPIDLLVVNLYPFEKTISGEEVSLEEAIEQIDIGGPAMIRSAAKNWRDVLVVTDPKLYEDVLQEMKENEAAVSLATRKRFAMLAFARTASYDLAISGFLSQQFSESELALLKKHNPLADYFFVKPRAEKTTEENLFPAVETLELAKVSDLRYGENPHQKAALYRLAGGGITNAKQLHGKEMSYNNFLDADAAWNLVNEFDERACAIIKHTNPSGVGLGKNNLEAYERALATDPVSAFGGIVAFNRKLEANAAQKLSEIFTEVVIAPDFENEALAILFGKKNLRVLRAAENETEIDYRNISGGILAQENDRALISEFDLRVATRRAPNDSEIRALLFAFRVCKHVKSNAIVIANEFQTVGVGAGQMNRVDSVSIAAMRAERTKLNLAGSALASDAFFPFRDGIDEAAKYGITAIIQPGGSVRDEETIAAADEHKIAMVFTGMRHFRH